MVAGRRRIAFARGSWTTTSRPDDGGRRRPEPGQPPSDPNLDEREPDWSPTVGESRFSARTATTSQIHDEGRTGPDNHALPGLPAAPQQPWAPDGTRTASNPTWSSSRRIPTAPTSSSSPRPAAAPPSPARRPGSRSPSHGGGVPPSAAARHAAARLRGRRRRRRRSRRPTATTTIGRSGPARRDAPGDGIDQDCTRRATSASRCSAARVEGFLSDLPGRALHEVHRADRQAGARGRRRCGSPARAAAASVKQQDGQGARRTRAQVSPCCASSAAPSCGKGAVVQLRVTRPRHDRARRARGRSARPKQPEHHRAAASARAPRSPPLLPG